MIFIYTVYQQDIKITHLNTRLDVEKINAQLLSIINREPAQIKFNFNCTISINENFGKWHKYSISTNGLKYIILDKTVTLTNSKNNIVKSWFPPREEYEGNSSVGNSVSTSADKYVLKLSSETYSNDATLLFKQLINICNIS